MSSRKGESATGRARVSNFLRATLLSFDRHGERWLLLVLYAAIVMIVVLEVLRRFLLAYSSVWGLEMTRFLFIYLAWIGAAAAVRDRAHIRIGALLECLPHRGQSALYLLSSVATLLLAVFALYWSLAPVETSLQFGSVTQALRISRVWALAAIPLGFALIVLRLLQSMRRDLRTLRTGAPPFRGRKLFE